MRRLASYARSANEKLSKDAFSEVSLEDMMVSQSASNKTKKVDFDTSKTLREFNEDLDEFSKLIRVVHSLSGFVIILMLIAFGIWASIAEIDVTVSSRKIMSAIPNVWYNPIILQLSRKYLWKKVKTLKKDNR